MELERSMRVSIIIPLFNRQNLVIRTLESISVQTHTNLECIIVDDHSTDNSFQVVEEYCRKDSRFALYKRAKPAKGAPVCRNEGMEKATGDTIMFLDSDDILIRECLEGRVRTLREHPTSDFIVKHVGIFKEVVGDTPRLWCRLDHEKDVNAFVKLEGWQTSSTFFKTSFAKKFRWDESACSWQDLEFHLRMLLHHPIYFKDKDAAPDVYIYRGEDPRISAGNRTKARMECLFKLFLSLEDDLIRTGHCEAIPYMSGNWFRFLEIAAIDLPRSDFDELRELWKQAESYRSLKTVGVGPYLVTQSLIRVGKIAIFNGLLYRIARMVFPKILTKKLQRI